jgi:hypothetical protein
MVDRTAVSQFSCRVCVPPRLEGLSMCSRMVEVEATQALEGGFPKEGAKSGEAEQESGRG